MNRDSLRSLLEQAGLKGIEDTANGFAAMCPFHHNTNTPAWGMNEDGLWMCFNPACAESGNLFTFLTRVMHMPAHAASQYIPAQEVTDEQIHHRLLPYEERGKERDDYEYLPEATLDPYKRCPLYMMSRGFPKHFLREYEVGFDAESNRVTFPIRDHRNGKLLGFTRRRVDNDEWPPYLHDYDKSRTIYLLHLVRPGEPILLTEGPVDALKARWLSRFVHDARIAAAMRNAVSTNGGRFSHSYGVELSRVYNDSAMVLGFDNDDPGVAARETAIRILTENGLARQYVLRFPSEDLGALDRSQLKELDLIPSFKRHSAAR